MKAKQRRSKRIREGGGTTGKNKRREEIAGESAGGGERKVKDSCSCER